MIRPTKEEEENESNNSATGVETSDKKNATSCSSGSGEAEDAGISCLELDAWIGDGESMDCMMLLPEMPLDGEDDSPSPDTSMHHSSASQDECNNPEDIFCRSSSGSSTTNQSNQEALELNLPDGFFPNKQQAEQVQEPPVTPSAQRPRCLDLKKIIVKKPVMDKAVERLGGGRRGALRLWNIIQVWLRCQEQGSAAAADSLNGLMQPFGSSNASLGTEFLNFADQQVFPSSLQPNQLQYNNAQFACFQDPSLAVPQQPPPQIPPSSFYPSEMTGVDGVVSAPPPAFSSAATTRAARKSRMARQRRQRGGGSHQAHSSMPSPAPSPLQTSSPAGTPTAATSAWTSSSSMFMRSSAHAAEQQLQHQREQFISCHTDKAGPNCDRNASFLLQKELKPSDVGNLGRIVLPKGHEKT